MASAQQEQEVWQRVTAVGQAQGWSQAEIDEQAGALLTAMDMAAAGDVQAQTALPEILSFYGISEPAANTPAAATMAAPTYIGEEAEEAPMSGWQLAGDLLGQLGGAIFGTGHTAPEVQQTGVASTLPPGATPWGGRYSVVDDPATGRRFYVDNATGEISSSYELEGGGAGGGTYAQKIAALAQMEEALGRPLSDYERSRFLLGFAPPSGGGSGMTAYQAAQLALQRQELGLERLQALTQAARTPQPLAYLAMLRGQVPTGAGYAGLSKVVPTVEGVAGAGLGGSLPQVPGGMPQTGGQGWEPVATPEFIRQLQAGGPLSQPQIPQGTIRAPGLQAQARMTPYEWGALEEAVEMQGVPWMDYEDYLRRMRQSAGSALPQVTYGGRG